MATEYEALRQRHQADAMALLPEHLARIMWSRECLQAHREQSLRMLVEVAQRQSPWHKKRLGHLNADQLREEDLRDIPVMTKQDLMANFDDLGAGESLPFLHPGRFPCAAAPSGAIASRVAFPDRILARRRPLPGGSSMPSSCRVCCNRNGATRFAEAEA